MENKKDNKYDTILENNQELITQTLKFIAKTNMEFEERGIPFEIKMDFIEEGNLLSFAKPV